MARRPGSNAARRTAPIPGADRGQRGGTLIGMFVGLILGLTLAAGIAYYLSKGGALSGTGATRPEKEPAKAVARPDTVAPSAGGRFGFYDILTGGEAPRIKAPDSRPLGVGDRDRPLPGDPVKSEPAKVEPAKVEPGKVELVKAEPAKSDVPKPEAAGRDRFFLQAGAFQSGADAENQKARLALAGFEAAIQVATLPDRSTWYRVRVGPFDNPDEMNRQRAELGKRGFDVAVIKNP